ncbi:MAG: 1,4-alpha-glucan branching protein GlgB [Simkaniaceae bacterium]
MQERNSYEFRGAHLTTSGVRFSLWAPSAIKVSVIGDFNHWNESKHVLEKEEKTGVFSGTVHEAKEGDFYLFHITTLEGKTLIKSDPFGRSFELRPGFKARVINPDRFTFDDQEWMENRKSFEKKPLNIYELHLGSWKRSGEEFLNYRQIAHELAEYVKKMNYTHVEFLPILEHPLDESWGYQVTGFFAPSSRFGELFDFQYLVNTLHKEGIGVILDWVPAHFPKDDHALAHFDGSFLYEYEDPLEGFHPDWKTHIFNYEKKEVREFLISSALYFIEKCHVDGIRVDAVSSILYRDYGRKEGEWIPNCLGGSENLEGISFLKELNQTIKSLHPNVIRIAEEASFYNGVTKSVNEGGLGFDLKWNMGWMNDSLTYFQTNIHKRHLHFEVLTHTFSFAHDERFLLPLSHDEVVHEKKSLIMKMPGNEAERFKGLKLLLLYKMCYPGKKLLFMGGEIAQFNEWFEGEQLHWPLLNLSQNSTFQIFVKELNQFYLETPPFWEKDFEKEAFRLSKQNDFSASILCFQRCSETRKVFCLFNFSETDFKIEKPNGIQLFISHDEKRKKTKKGQMILPGLTGCIYELD